jgi:chromosome segregation ATPase
VTRIKKVEKTCEELDDRLTKLDKDSAVDRQRMLDALENLSKMPETLNEVNKTMVSMQKEISDSSVRIGGLEDQFDSLKNDFKEVDEEGKFNIRKAIKDNWLGITMGLGAIIYFLNQLR